MIQKEEGLVYILHVVYSSNEFYKKFNAYSLVPTIAHQIKVLKKYKKKFLDHEYFENEKNDKQ